MQYKVSVITPSYNQHRFIERTINSVLSQQFSGSLEFRVVDGGSRDGTVDTLKRYGSSLQWISEKDHGQAEAVNKGLAQATGNVIGWLNSDDIYYPDAIATACQIFDSHPEVDVVYGNANHIDEYDRILDAYPTEAWNFDRLLETCYLCQPAVFFRRRVIDRFGPLDENLHFCLDYEYWIRIGGAGAKFFWVQHVLAGSRLYPETKTLGSRIRVHREINDMVHRYAGRVPDRWLFNYAHAVLDEKRIPRSDRVRFPLLLSAISVYASLRWNQRISSSLSATTRAWAAAAVRGLFHGRLVK
jgi:glycosyltransferase involved in cell wall biosynthesis